MIRTINKDGTKTWDKTKNYSNQTVKPQSTVSQLMNRIESLRYQLVKEKALNAKYLARGLELKQQLSTLNPPISGIQP